MKKTYSEFQNSVPATEKKQYEESSQNSDLDPSTSNPTRPTSCDHKTDGQADSADTQCSTSSVTIQPTNTNSNAGAAVADKENNNECYGHEVCDPVKPIPLKSEQNCLSTPVHTQVHGKTGSETILDPHNSCMSGIPAVNFGEEYANGKVYSILLLDSDDEALCHAQKVLSSNARWIAKHTSVSTFSEPETAFTALSSDLHFDLFIVDFHLSQINGSQLMKIMNIAMRRSCPVILTSVDIRLKPTWKSLGVASFLSKPLTSQDVNVIMDLLESAPSTTGMNLEERRRSSSIDDEPSGSGVQSEPLDHMRTPPHLESYSSLNNLAQFPPVQDALVQILDGAQERSDGKSMDAYWETMKTPLDLVRETLHKIAEGQVVTPAEIERICAQLNNQSESSVPCVLQEMNSLHCSNEVSHLAPTHLEGNLFDIANHVSDIMNMERGARGFPERSNNSIPPNPKTQRSTSESGRRRSDEYGRSFSCPHAGYVRPRFISDIKPRLSHSVSLHTSKFGISLDKPPSYVSDHQSINVLLACDPKIADLPGFQTLEKILVSMPCREFDIFELADIAEKPYTLPAVGMVMFHKLGLLDVFPLDIHTLFRYMSRIAEEMPDNPYHNHQHVADVVHSAALMVSQARETPEAEIWRVNMGSIEVLALMFAALVHDVGHLGVTNDFLEDTGHQLATEYGNKNILEMYHISMAFKLLKVPGLNIFEHLENAEYVELRQLIIKLVGATSMKKHFKIVAAFKPLSEKLKSSTETRDDSRNTPIILSYNEKTLVLSIAIKIADLGHLRAPPSVHRAFTKCLLNEFYNQGDRLAEMGREVGPMFRRCPESDIPDQQCGFFTVFALPLACCWTQIVDSRWFVDIESNYIMWGNDIKEYKLAAEKNGETPTLESF